MTIERKRKKGNVMRKEQLQRLMSTTTTTKRERGS